MFIRLRCPFGTSEASQKAWPSRLGCNTLLPGEFMLVDHMTKSDNVRGLFGHEFHNEGKLHHDYIHRREIRPFPPRGIRSCSATRTSPNLGMNIFCRKTGNVCVSSTQDGAIQNQTKTPNQGRMRPRLRRSTKESSWASVDCWFRVA